MAGAPAGDGERRGGSDRGSSRGARPIGAIRSGSVRVIATGPGQAVAPTIAAADVAIAAQLACLLEASAPKPGNVSPGRHFADARYEEFLASAAAIGGPLAGAGARPLGETVRLAIESTANWTRSNTNLGLVLVLAPLARAASIESRVGLLRDSLRMVLATTTVGDARDAY